MNIRKHLIGNLAIGAVLGLILSPFIWMILNMLSSKLEFGNMDIFHVIIIIVPLCMIGISIVFRERIKIKE